MPGRNYIAVPQSLRGISTIDTAAECAPEEVGLTAAGVAAMPVPHPWRSALYDFDVSVGALCAAPASQVGTPKYHAFTGGFVLGEILRRASR